MHKRSIRTIRQARIKKGTRVLLRVDFDVAFRRGRVQNDFRIHAALPTINFILKKGGMVRLVAHAGRPRGKVKKDLSLKPVARILSRFLRHDVPVVENPFHDAVFERHNDTASLILFENIRFWPGEEKNSKRFARRLARWGDIYVNDAFANSHRAHASVAAIAEVLPAYAGIHLAEEVTIFERLITKPRKPVVMVMGGAKLETKLPLVKTFLQSGCIVLAGGAIANTFLVARGIFVGTSVVDKALIKAARTIAQNPCLHLPSDVVVARGLDAKHKRVVPVDAVARGEAILDIGPSTVRHFVSVLRTARTVFWNGPVGYAEIQKFATGTIALARSIKRSGAFSVIGGGDTTAILQKYGVYGGVSHISTGGGAALEFLAGEKLPGIEALQNKKQK